MRPPCSFQDCGRPSLCLGVCQGHYSQLRRGRELTPLRPAAPRRQSRPGEPLVRLPAPSVLVTTADVLNARAESCGVPLVRAVADLLDETCS